MTFSKHFNQKQEYHKAINTIKINKIIFQNVTTATSKQRLLHTVVAISETMKCIVDYKTDNYKEHTPVYITMK